MSKRTTFFTVERAGCNITLTGLSLSSDQPRAWDLIERSNSNITQHRAGAWSRPALERLAHKMGGKLRTAYSMAYDGRFFDRRDIA